MGWVARITTPPPTSLRAGISPSLWPAVSRWAGCPGSLLACVPTSPGYESFQVAGTPTSGGLGALKTDLVCVALAGL